MANKVTSYFFPPQWNFHVGGPISLGNIITDPKTPQYALNVENRQSLPSLFVDDVKPHLEATIKDDSTGSAGIGSALLQLFGLSANVDAEWSKNTTWTIAAEEVLTQEINPIAKYVEACFNHAEVQDHLQRTQSIMDRLSSSKELYMIIGIMAASSATVSSEITKKHLFDAKFVASLAPATGGLPLDVHLKGSTSAERGTKASFGKSDFVLAYKLRKITYLKTQKVKKMEDVKGKGTVLDSNGMPQPSAEDDAVEFKFARLEEDAIQADEFELASVTAQVAGDTGSEPQLEFVLPLDSDSME